ncbi:MAG: topoisomerase [Pseudomonadota bacterium]|jgi:DNA topoisomerase-1
MPSSAAQAVETSRSKRSPGRASVEATTRDERADPVLSAERAGLRYVHDRQPGITRKKNGKGFSYLSAQGKVVRDTPTLKRIHALVIPPAWTDVWICADPNGHIQSTGRDVKGRKQYRYHTRFREVRDETKYEKIFDFAAALPKIRARCESDLSRPGLSREKVLAAVVSLLEQTLIRVGNEEYSRLNQSFGLTTLRDGHAKIRGASVEFQFRGKSGKEHAVAINDRRLAKIVKRCRDLPGDELFQYLADDGTRRTIDSSDVNEYLRQIASDDFTAKDFRTFAGTVIAANALAEAGLASSETASKKTIVSAIKSAAGRLGNTPAVCRKCYVHPGIFEAYMRGRVVPRIAAGGAQLKNSLRARLRADERAVLAFLKRHLAEVAKEQTPGGLVSVLERSVKHAAARGLAKTRGRRKSA